MPGGRGIQAEGAFRSARPRLASAASPAGRAVWLAPRRPPGRTLLPNPPPSEREEGASLPPPPALREREVLAGVLPSDRLRSKAGVARLPAPSASPSWSGASGAPPRPHGGNLRGLPSEGDRPTLHPNPPPSEREEGGYPPPPALREGDQGGGRRAWDSGAAERPRRNGQPPLRHTATPPQRGRPHRSHLEPPSLFHAAALAVC